MVGWHVMLLKMGDMFGHYARAFRYTRDILISFSIAEFFNETNTHLINIKHEVKARQRESGHECVAPI